MPAPQPLHCWNWARLGWRMPGVGCLPSCTVRCATKDCACGGSSPCAGGQRACSEALESRPEGKEPWEGKPSRPLLLPHVPELSRLTLKQLLLPLPVLLLVG